MYVKPKEKDGFALDEAAIVPYSQTRVNTKLYVIFGHNCCVKSLLIWIQNSKKEELCNAKSKKRR